MRPFAGIDRGADRGRPRLPRPELLDAATSSLKGVGSKTETALRQLGIDTLRDLLLYRPRRYEPPAPRSTISALIAGQPATIVCAVTSVSVRRTRRRSLTIVEALVTDDSGSIVATWFNQAWLLDRLTPGLAVELRGSVERTDFVVRSYDLEGTGELDRITPVYPASEALPSKRLRELVSQVIGYAGDVPDPLPAELRARLGLPAKADAILAIHEPTTANEAETARRRLAFEELLVMQVGLAVRRSAEQVGGARSLGEPGELIRRYLELLPFSLTAGQERVLREIDADLGRSEPMERLLQGDVGSGKTVVALYVLLRAVEAGHQGALMAPTETLAEQHFMTIEQLCADLGVPCLLLTGSRGKPALREARGLLTTGEAGIAVGTH
ncbi:MAG: DEAD/DEAH box helicase, partial [Gaiellales bacterium]